MNGPKKREAYNTTIMSHGSDDIFLAKYSNNGKFLWVKGLGNRGCNIARCMALDGSNIYLTGNTSGSFFNSNEINKGPLAFLASFNNNDGSLIWYQEEAAPIIYHSSLCVDDNYIYWGTSVIILPDLEKIDELNNRHFYFINKVSKNGDILFSGTYKIKVNEDYFKLLTLEDSIFICDNQSGKISNISSLLIAESYKSNELPSANELIPDLYPEKSNFANYKADYSLMEKVRLTKPVLSDNGQFLKHLISENCVTINQNKEVELRFNGNIHTCIPSVSDFKIVAATNENDQYIYLLANYSGNILVKGSQYLSSKSRNIFLMKIALMDMDSESFLGDDIALDGLISVNPNPSTSGVFKIECSNQIIDVKSMIVKDCIDQVVYSNFNGRLPALIDISTQPGGIYFLVIELENKTTEIKLILAK